MGVGFLSFYYYAGLCSENSGLLSCIGKKVCLVLCFLVVYLNYLVVCVYIQQCYVRICDNSYTIFEWRLALKIWILFIDVRISVIFSANLLSKSWILSKWEVVVWTFSIFVALNFLFLVVSWWFELVLTCLLVFRNLFRILGFMMLVILFINCGAKVIIRIYLSFIFL